MQRNQHDANSKTRDLDYPRKVQRKTKQTKRTKVKPKERLLMQQTLNKVQTQLRMKRKLMYVDTGSNGTIGNNTASTFAVLANITSSIVQGAGQSARPSDVLWLERIEAKMLFYYNFTATGLTQDYVQTIRMTVFQWHPNTALVVPTPGSLFQNVASTGVLSSFDFELKDDYHVLRDEFITVSGFYDGTTAFAFPNAGSMKTLVTSIPLSNSRVDYSPGATTASNQLYLALNSDSTNGPNPNYSFILRTYYYVEL